MKKIRKFYEEFAMKINLFLMSFVAVNICASEEAPKRPDSPPPLPARVYSSSSSSPSSSPVPSVMASSASSSSSSASSSTAPSMDSEEAPLSPRTARKEFPAEIEKFEIFYRFTQLVDHLPKSQSTHNLPPFEELMGPALTRSNLVVFQRLAANVTNISTPIMTDDNKRDFCFLDNQMRAIDAKKAAERKKE